MTLTRPLLVVLIVALSGGCFLKKEPTASERVELTNRLYLDGEWSWADTVRYAGYTPRTDSIPHRGTYVVSGTATLEELDSTDVESYAMTVISQVFHVDSALEAEVTRWTVQDIEFEDTVRVEHDTIFGLEVEPIPPAANATTAAIRWTLAADQLWCTNWLTDTVPPSNASDCSTTVVWLRADSAAADTTGSVGDSTAAR